MPKTLTITIPHQLGKEAARQRIDTSIAQVFEPLGRLASVERQQWAGDHLQFGIQLASHRMDGRIDVAENQVRIELDLPWLLATLGERVKGAIQKRGQILLEKK